MTRTQKKTATIVTEMHILFPYASCSNPQGSFVHNPALERRCEYMSSSLEGSTCSSGGSSAMNHTAGLFHPAASSPSHVQPHLDTIQMTRTTATIYHDHRDHYHRLRHHHPPAPPARTSSLMGPNFRGSSMLPSVQIIQPISTKIHETRRKSATSPSSNESATSPKMRQGRGTLEAGPYGFRTLSNHQFPRAMHPTPNEGHSFDVIATAPMSWVRKVWHAFWAL